MHFVDAGGSSNISGKQPKAYRPNRLPPAQLSVDVLSIIILLPEGILAFLKAIGPFALSWEDKTTLALSTKPCEKLQYEIAAEFINFDCITVCLFECEYGLLQPTKKL